MQMVNIPGGSDGKESAYNIGDLGLILGLGRSLKNEMATHSSILARKIPWMEKPGRLQSMGPQRVRCNWMTSLSLFISPWLASFKPSSPHHPERRTMAQPCLNTSLSLYHSKHNSQTPKKSITTRVLFSIHFLFSPSAFLLSGMQQFFVTCIQHGGTWLFVSA